MKILGDIYNYVQHLGQEDFERYSRLFLIAVVCFSGLTIYYIYSKSSDLILGINNTKRLSFETVKIVKEHKRMKAAEEKLTNLLSQNRDFNMNTFFEEFCSSNNLTPDTDWESLVKDFPGSDKFDEVSISAAFKNQTTKKLVDVLEAINKKEIVYVKDIGITNEKNGKIAFEITLATKRFKKNI